MNVARSSGLRAFARWSKAAGAASCAFRPSSRSFANGFPAASGVVEDEDVLQLRAVRLGLQELRGLIGGRGEGDGGAAVADDVLGLVGDHGREDRDEDAAVALAGEVDRRPLGTVLGEEDDRASVRECRECRALRRRPSRRPRTRRKRPGATARPSCTGEGRAFRASRGCGIRRRECAESSSSSPSRPWKQRSIIGSLRRDRRR